jgi:hypothetical protein
LLITDTPVLTLTREFFFQIFANVFANDLGYFRALPRRTLAGADSQDTVLQS